MVVLTTPSSYFKCEAAHGDGSLGLKPCGVRKASEDRKDPCDNECPTSGDGHRGRVQSL